MLSQMPFDLGRMSGGEVDKEVVRLAIIGELDTINLYEQLAAMTGNELLKKVFLDVAGEEKTHVGEFQTMLLRLDEEQVKELDAGRKEVEEMEEKP